MSTYYLPTFRSVPLGRAWPEEVGAAWAGGEPTPAKATRLWAATTRSDLVRKPFTTCSSPSSAFRSDVLLASLSCDSQNYHSKKACPRPVPTEPEPAGLGATAVSMRGLGRPGPFGLYPTARAGPVLVPPVLGGPPPQPRSGDSSAREPPRPGLKRGRPSPVPGRRWGPGRGAQVSCAPVPCARTKPGARTPRPAAFGRAEPRAGAASRAALRPPRQRRVGAALVR